MDISKIGNISPAQVSLPGKAQAAGSFHEIYQDQLTAISPTDSQPPIDAKKDLMDQGDKVLDLLNVYTTDLGNPEKTLKDIDPLATAIEEEMNVFAACGRRDGRFCRGVDHYCQRGPAQVPAWGFHLN